MANENRTQKNGWGVLFLRHFVIAIPWGIVFLVVLFIAAMGLKQQVKEAIQYTAVQAMRESGALVRDGFIVTGIKQNTKEGVEFVAKTAGAEIKTLLNDPQVRRNLKEIFQD